MTLSYHHPAAGLSSVVVYMWGKGAKGQILGPAITTFLAVKFHERNLWGNSMKTLCPDMVIRPRQSLTDSWDKDTHSS